MKLIYSFSDKDTPSLGEVGGKGLSLIKMSRAGLPVPPGFVLTVSFFKSWFDTIKSGPEWNRFLNSSSEELGEICSSLKDLAYTLELTEEQKKEFYRILTDMGSEKKFFAVRSSSPEEDLEGASFAGGYETVLGVNPDGMEEAIKKAFASCLDKRVVLYKKEHDFSIDDPKIAIVIQEQIASETSGVGFTLNPLNNCYDEGVINTNWGLGESVVSGIVSPDQFIVDKVNRKILDKKPGKKEVSVWLTDKGGTEEREDSRHGEFTLSDNEILELTDILNKIETFYEKPMDIEWAYGEGKLYMLQARPITTHIPLPEEMITVPGKEKHLYLDLALTNQGIHGPISVMGCDWINSILSRALKEVFGRNLLNNISEGIGKSCGCRLYMNLSNLFTLVTKEFFAGRFRMMDTLTSDILLNSDVKEYIPKKAPSCFKGIKLSALWNMPDAIAGLFEAAILPEHMAKNYQRQVEKYLIEMKAEKEKKQSFKDFAEKTMEKTAHIIMHTMVPVFLISIGAEDKIRKLFEHDSEEVRKQLDNIDRSLPGNVTVEMGLALYHLSELTAPEDMKDVDSFNQKIRERNISGEFLHGWDDFMEKYGFRGAVEMDISTDRYVDNPGMLLQQIISLSKIKDTAQNPQTLYEQSQKERYKAFEYLSEVAHKKGWITSRKFQRFYRIIETFGGYRENHKYYMIKLNHMLREKVLKEADMLVKEGRLDYKEQVFDLTFDDLDRGLSDPSLNLREIAEKNTEFLKKLKNIRAFPRIIDSRGKILRLPPGEVKEGELSGQPVSPGIVRGPVKVLRHPDEKPLEPGDILVARATNPGWTPLFINAASIVLEVGGMLQHGALVAREYGKPCVVGVENVMSILKDGQMVEVDGSTGIIRLLE
jgi:pyruvate,water dikinase